MAIGDKSGNAYVTVEEAISGGYVDSDFLPITGGTMTGDLTINRRPGRFSLVTESDENSYGFHIENTSSFGNEVNFYGGYGYQNFMSIKSLSESEIATLVLSPNGKPTTFSGPLTAGRTSIGERTNGTMVFDAYGGVGRIGCDADYYLYILGSAYGSAKGNVGIGGVSDQHKFYVQGQAGMYYAEYAQLLLYSSSSEASIYFKPNGGSASYSMWAMGPGCWNLTDYFAFGVYAGPGSSSWKLAIDYAGNVFSESDQVIQSDEKLKENIKPIEMSVYDIASAPAVTFDWKDGRGRSAGSIAQYWKPIIPELANGEEGNMSLSYGQLGLVNSVIVAKKSVAIGDRIEEIEKKCADMDRTVSVLLEAADSIINSFKKTD